MHQKPINKQSTMLYTNKTNDYKRLNSSHSFHPNKKQIEQFCFYKVHKYSKPHH